VTFEQWWGNKEAGIRRSIFASVDTGPLLAAAIDRQLNGMRAEVAACWNDALHAAVTYKHPAGAEEIVTHIYSLRVRP
jgi:hypothetical protein